MQWSEEIDQIASGLVLAQSKIAGAEKSSKNPGLRNDYADLDAVWTMIRPALRAAGLAVIQAPDIVVQDGSKYALVTTVIMHSSGQWLQHKCSIPVPAGNRGVNEAQACGVAVTYARRYSILALLSVAGEDTDGHVSRHHPSWKNDCRRFCAALTTMHSLTYEQLADYLEKAGRMRPSEMDREGRKALWSELAELVPKINGAKDD